MAEDRNNPQGFVGQAHTVEHGGTISMAAPSMSSVESKAGMLAVSGGGGGGGTAGAAAVAGVSGGGSSNSGGGSGDGEGGGSSGGGGSVGGGDGGRTITQIGDVQRDDSPPRGPRTLLLRRGENGFGFTLRHFIVYPPESCCILPGHERTRIEEPMDTIFVKQVRGNSPAAEAGLRTGDRVVSVDGKATRGEQYAKVVQRIQQAGPWLRLLVVSKEDDILQRYFGETAHNPETNQRPRLRSPERSAGQKQRRSVSMIPGLSPRTRQSWVCSAPSSIQCEPDRPLDDAPYCEQETREFSKEQQMRAHKVPLQAQSSVKATTYHAKPFQDVAGRPESLDDKLGVRNHSQQSIADDLPKLADARTCERSIHSDSRYDKYDVYDRTRPDSIYSRTNSEQIYDRIKDPIYEHVRLGEPSRLSAEEHDHHHHRHHHHHYQQHHYQQQYYPQAHQQASGVTRYSLSRAEPQVPIYRPAMRRVSSRRASEGSTSSSTINNFEVASYASADALRSCDPGSRFSIDSGRDSSPIRSTGDPPRYDSSCVLPGVDANGGRVEARHGNSSGARNANGSSGIDDSVIMTRLRKSFEQKEEFLRRPSHPIGWFLSEERSESPVRGGGSTTIPREFYARPQKLQKQIWPPNDPKQDRQCSPPTVSGQDRGFEKEKLALEKFSSTLRNEQRLKRSGASVEAEQPEYFSSSRSLEDAQSVVMEDRLCSPAVLYNDCREISEPKEADKHQQPTHRNTAGKSSFVGTLSRIHENITSAAALLSSERHSQDARSPCPRDASSLPSSPGPEKKANDKLPALPQGLQIVSKRAKQFESGRLLSDDDEPTGDRTSLYKSELSRLSSKRSVPNVAVRKREFESKAEAQEPRRSTVSASRETKSLDAGNGLKGNRIIPVGSGRIHCEPPTDYTPAEETSNPLPRYTDSGTLCPRIRSNSEESWESIGDRLQVVKHRWPQRQEALGRKQASRDKENENVDANVNEKGKGKENEDSYGNTGDSVEDDNKKSARSAGSKKQDGYPKAADVEHGAVTNDSVHSNGVVFRRQKNAQIADEDRATRRVSYLKATWGERMHVDSDLELSDSEPIHSSRISSTCAGQEATGVVKNIVEQVDREGPLHVKFTVLDGKRSSDRSWKQVWGVLRGPILFFYKDRQNQSPSLTNESEGVAQSVDVRCSLVDIAEDYTKRKHVLRLANPSAEVLLQSEDAASMALWLRSLHEHAAAEKPSEVVYNSTLKQQAVPQTPGPTSSSSTAAYQTIGGNVSDTMMISNTGGSSGNNGNSGNGGNGGNSGGNGGNNGSGQRLSPLPGHKGIKKLTSFRNRSPTGQLPINKTRKPSQTIESLVSPKTKTWKGRVAKQLRRMHGQTGPPSSPTTQLPPEGATFKVPLELCPPSSFSEYVPLIVEMCTSIVEARGLEVVGIYRVPGNTAAISHLTESVNKGFDNINLQDPRWSDVNVISSLLKSFFRQLPDSLLTAELYPMFIDADKVEDPQRRMTTIRKLLRDLPEHHFETLKFLMFHLKRIVEHSEVNKMEAKNLAIVFGPTLVRASGSRDNMVTMVTDMSHQCRIVESLLNNVEWFFSDDDLDDLSRLSVNLSLPADTNETDTIPSNNHSLLLNNIQKVEGVREMASAKDIVSSIISAANRKIQRRRKGQDETDNENHELDKSKSKQEAESLANRRSMALNERQCSVSEIVLMHENKSQPNRCADRSATVDAAAMGIAAIAGGGSAAGLSDTVDAMADAIGGNDDGAPFDRTRKYFSPPAESISAIQPPHCSAVSSTSESSSRLSSETGLSCFDASSVLSSASNETKQSNDEITIRTYAGLSATTQERIRRFEQETKAMLQRDQNRQRREAEKREEERRRIEMEWQLAKREMENDDLLDSIVDTTVAPNYFANTARLSAFNDRLADKSYLDIGSRSTGRIPSLSIAVQQEPTTARRFAHGNDSAAAVAQSMPATQPTPPSPPPPPPTPTPTPPPPPPTDNVTDIIVKKLKTDKEESTLEPLTSPPIRYGSLDSLHETHDVSHSSLSPSMHQQRKQAVSGDVSDDGRMQVPGSMSDVPSAAGDDVVRRSSIPIAPFPRVPPASEPSELSESVELVEQSRRRVSGSGAGLSSKTLNRFLRGSDLLTSLTTTFDRKWKSLVNSSGHGIRGSAPENASVSDEDIVGARERERERDKEKEKERGRDSPQILRQMHGAREERDERKLSMPVQPVDPSLIETYRDPSLHKSALQKHQHVRQKNDIPEKDTDCSVAANCNVERLVETDIPDNDRSAIARRRIESKDQLRCKEACLVDAGLESNEAQECCRLSTQKDAGAPVENDKAMPDNGKYFDYDLVDPTYTNKLERFESLTTNLEVRSRLKRSESLNKRTENTCSKLKRSESLNKHSAERLSSPTSGKLKRSESLNKHSERSDSPNSKLKRSESLTKTEKTECNISKRRQSVRKDSATKLKRKNGMPERSLKRRHTVGGTKDFDKVHWLDNKLQAEAEKVVRNEYRPKKCQLRTSSPDLSTGRIGALTDASFLIEVSFRGPSNVVFNVATNARPQSLPDTSVASKVFKVPLESHV
ncbi:rho GTPase activating protein at 19D isoform X4 [Nomia melanderi]|uniref:rho GTPase activating protein at 19D isoform X4 n=1 Tax=Nomia melanderi TaxID=2448451 RepID=UPI003FCC49A7